MSLEKVFVGLLSDSDSLYVRRNNFLSIFRYDDLFTNEYYVFYHLIKKFTKLKFNEDFIKMFMKTNRAFFMNNPQITLYQYDENSEDVYDSFITSCVVMFTECKSKGCSDEDFELALEMLKMEYVTKESLVALENATLILTDGKKERNRLLSGYQDMRKYLKTRLVKIDNIVNKKDRKGAIVYGVTDTEEVEDTKLELITTFGIPTVDKALGGIYEGDMVSVLAPAKGGKTRFCTSITHRAITNHGTNVLMWSIENGYLGFEALIRARHFHWLYNSNETDVSKMRIINSDMIRKKQFPSKDIQDLEYASFMDFKTNPNYGKLVNVDEDFEFDTFIDIIDEYVNAYNVKLICIDYLQLITGDDRMSKHERIAEAYKKILQYLKSKKIAGIFPAQFKQTALQDLKKNKEEGLANIELRSAGGESYEVIKTPDVNLALYADAEDIRNGSMNLISIPSRNSVMFDPVSLHVDFGTCSYYEIE